MICIVETLVKCSMFGEYKPPIQNYDFIAVISKWTNFILIFISFFAIVKLIIKHYIKGKKDENSSVIGKFFITYFTIIFAYIYGVFSMPYGCTMDFRYIVPTAFLGTTFIFIDLDESEKTKYYRNVIYILSAIFIIVNFISIFTLMKFLQ